MGDRMTVDISHDTGYLLGVPPKILYGKGAVSRIADCIKDFHSQKVLVVTDPVLVKCGITGKVTGCLERAGIPYVLFDSVCREPTDLYVEDALALLKAENCDSVIAVGGGSCMDVGKGVALMAANEGVLSDYEGRNIVIPRDKLPMIAVATTAGTGSEISNVATIIDTRRTTKMVIKNERMRVNIAVCDPELTMTTPPKVTAACGVDAMAHALEGYISKQCQPFTDMVALEAIRLIYGSIEDAWRDGSNEKARGDMMMGAFMAGIVFSNSSCVSIHGLARPIGTIFEVPHGVSIAMVFSATLDYTLPAVTDKFANIARVIGLDIRGKSEREAGRMAIDAIKAKCRAIRIPTIREYGIDAEKFQALIPEMAKDFSGEGNHKLNPVYLTVEEREEIYRRLLDE